MFRRQFEFVALLALGVALTAFGCGGGQTSDTKMSEPAPATGTASDWEQTLERVVQGVVVLKVTVPRDFDTDGGGSYMGTGFIVDAERGLILTNRHLVQPGPVVAEAIFLNHEEIPLKAIYRDPVHDFGFFQFDPDKVKFNELEEIELAPEGARVGVDIRVVGNDAGEKLSILSGTLARLDRDAPRYDSVGFNDFNTFYYQAASGTSGGSSGSPVIDIQGRAIALNAGGAFLAESSFFLPLDRVVRALDQIRADQPVTRGTIQTIFIHTPYDDLRRLGLPLEVETRMREAFPDAVGLLAVDEIVPGSPAAEKLEPGDVLVTLDGEPVRTFIALEERFDSSVGEAASLGIIRGGESLDVEIPIQDLHAITPNEYIEVGDAILHPLGYQQARNFRQPAEGLYVARSGYMLGSAGLSWGSLIKSIDGEPVATMDDLWRVLTTRKDRDRMQIRYVIPFDTDQVNTAVVYLDRRWFPLQWCKRNDMGDWPCDIAPPATERWAPEPGSVEIPQLGKPPASALARSFVMVENDMPHYVEGIFATHYVGTGLVVDAEKGLVVTDRDTVPALLGDIQITFGGSLRVPAKVRYVHPTHNFAVVQYDTALIGDTPIETAKFDPKPLETGDKTWLVGMDRSYNLVSSESKVDKVAPLRLAYPDFPAFRDSNIEVYEASAAAKTLGGVLADENGVVRALWVSYGVDMSGPVFKGIPIDHVTRVVEPLARGEEPDIRILGLELRTMNLADARDYGLPDDELATLQSAGGKRRQAITIARTYSGFPSSELLFGGDIILAVNGTPATAFDVVEEAENAGESVSVKVLREGEVLTVDVPTVAADGRGIDHVASWGGMLLHDEHLPIAAQRSIDLDGVYIAWTYSGSPASHFGVSPSQRIIEVNDVAVKTLDDLLAQVKGLDDGTPVRLLLADFDGLEQLVAIETDSVFWPAWELRYEGEEWVRNDFR